MVAGKDIMWVCHTNQSPRLILMAAQRFTPAAEFWVWSLPGPNKGQASPPLWRVHLAWSESTSFSDQEHRPCSKLQRSSKPLSSILLLIGDKNRSISTKCTETLKAEVGVRILFFLLLCSKMLHLPHVENFKFRSRCCHERCEISPQSLSSEWSPQSSL